MQTGEVFYQPACVLPLNDMSVHVIDRVTLSCLSQRLLGCYQMVANHGCHSIWVAAGSDSLCITLLSVQGYIAVSVDNS